ncbi:hypothetical protein ACFO0N_13705 [Halobium salinum]|uniref:MFS transporter n=1 Tax=Halobium salinum TaxID=1364940 RepID=A0ABD5PEN9_9EURY|nr:hypothetical protein [Halobium salinum]
MPREGRTTGAVAYDVSGFAAAHPRLVLTAALTVLFIAMQGTVGAELFEAGTNSAASSDTGP